MPLPHNFRFSQASLSDYCDCARRFQLRYLQERAWPAVESEPLLERERLAELGRRFHRLIQQHVEGLSAALLAPAASERELARWWQCYLHGLDTTLCVLPGPRRAEVALSIPFKTYRLAAHFDLIAASAAYAVIVDWKTEQRLPTRDQLRQRLQTRVYRYTLTVAQQRPPGSVSMIYWFAQHPERPVTLPYDAAQHADDQQFLCDLLGEIERRAAGPGKAPGIYEDGDWEQTSHPRKCAYCVYRSLCNRGVRAGLSDPAEEDFDLAARINIEQIDAIEY